MEIDHDTPAENDTDDDFDWEEVAVPAAAAPVEREVTDLTVEDGPSNIPQSHIEITIRARPKKSDAEKCVGMILLLSILTLAEPQGAQGCDTSRASEPTQLS